jgi:hypothetical protein
LSRFGQLRHRPLLTPISPYPDRILDWDTHQKGRIWCREEIVYSGFAKMFTLKCSNRPLNKGRSKHTRVRRALSSLEHARRAPPRAPVSRQAKPASLPCARTYKTPRDIDRTPSRPLDLTGAPDHRLCLVHDVPTANRTPATVDRPAEPLSVAPGPRSRSCMPR